MTEPTPSSITPALTGGDPTVEEVGKTGFPAGVTPSSFFYIDKDQNRLVESNGVSSRIRSDLEDLGEIAQTAVVEDQVLVLSALGIQQIDLRDNSHSIIRNFEIAARVSLITQSVDRRQVLITRTIDNPGAESGAETLIYRLDQDQETVDLLYSSPRIEYPVGISVDGSDLYILSRGQDPAFQEIKVISTSSGVLIGTLPVHGYAVASLSPNGHTILTLDDSGGINLFHVADNKVIQVKQIPSPYFESYIWRYAWSPKGDAIYAVLVSGSVIGSDIQTPGVSYGLWKLAIEAEEMSSLIPVEPDGQPWITTSSNEVWMLLRLSDNKMGYLINTATGEIKDGLTLPMPILPSSEAWDWQPPSYLSDDGDWFIQRQLTQDRSGYKEEAFMVHLPSGAALSIQLPASLEWVVWH